MGFERFFFKTETTSAQHNSEGKDELSASGLQRRQLLKGAAALAASGVVLNAPGVRAVESLLASPEDQEGLVDSIRAYERWMKEHQEELARPDISAEQMWNILEGEHGIPITDYTQLEGTKIDRSDFFHEGGSWPSVQIREEAPNIHFARNRSKNDQYLGGYGNGFFLSGALIANRHAMENSFRCELLGGREDIGGCAVSELIADEGGRRKIANASLEWDRRKALQDISGNLVHIPYIHEKRGRESDRTDILSGVVFKVTEGLLTRDEEEKLFRSRATREFGEVFLSSYAFITKMRDSNGDNKSDAYDLEGVSGAPVFLDSDCESGVRMPVGLEWGAIDRTSPSGEKYTIVLMHGPEVLGAMLDMVKTIVSMELSEEEAPLKRSLTAKVQMALHEYGDDTVAIDGIYGNDTRQAVYNFQQRIFSKEMMQSQIIPGTVDRATWNALFPEEQDPDKKVLWLGH